MGINMLNETMIQLILIAICCVYIIFNTKADKNPKRGYRTALYLFVMAGIISYIMNYLNWLDFFLLITPIMCLFKFEDKWSQQHLTLQQVINYPLAHCQLQGVEEKLRSRKDEFRPFFFEYDGHVVYLMCKSSVCTRYR